MPVWTPSSILGASSLDLWAWWHAQSGHHFSRQWIHENILLVLGRELSLGFHGWWLITHLSSLSSINDHCWKDRGTHHNLNCLSSLSSITQWSLLEVQMPMHNSQERERETLSLTHTHKSRERKRVRERVSECVYMFVCVCIHACMCCNLYALNVFKICSFKDV